MATTKSSGSLDMGGVTGHDSKTSASTAGHVIRTYGETVLKQPVSGFPEIITKTAPSLIIHIKGAQANAEHYQSSIQPTMSANVGNLLNYSNMWASFTQTIRADAKADKKDQVISGLQALQSQVQNYSNTANTTHSTLTAFQKAIAGDAGKFKSDYNALMSKHSGVEAEIRGLDKEISAENKLITTGAGLIAGGAGAILLGGIAIIVGAATDVFTGGAATGLIIAGVVGAVGGGAMIAAGAVMVDKASSKLAEVTTKKNNLNNSLTILGAYGSTVNSLQTAVSSAVSAVGSLATDWSNLYGDMDAVIGDIKLASSLVGQQWFFNMLDTADKTWVEVGNLATAVQKQTANSKIVTQDVLKQGGLNTKVA